MTKTEYKSMPFDQIVQAVADNKADIAVAACDMTQDRADKVNFSSIYYNKESVSSSIASFGSRILSCRISLFLRSPPEKPSFR